MSTKNTQRVIDNGNCIGCGACAFASPDYTIDIARAGHFVARSERECGVPDLPPVCPMSGEGKSETQLAADLYPHLPVDNQIGRYASTLAGHVEDADFRDRGGSGGMVSWLAAEVLRRGLVDAVLHVKPQEDGEMLFRYGFSETVDEVRAGAKSRYYPVTMGEVLPVLAKPGRRTLVIGLPCFIKSIRLLQDTGLLSIEQVPYTLGLVCGHLKSRFFGDYLAWQTGCAPGSIQTLDFRHKLPDRDASRYAFSCIPEGSSELDKIVVPMTELHGRDWGEGLFKNPACEFCDDVLAECADVAVGDAWLPGYVDDYRGANVVVTRNAILDSIIQEARLSGALALDNVSVDQVIRSQSSGLRHRREGTAHRLARRKAKGEWCPEKRVEPQIAGSRQRRMVYDLRLRIAQRTAPIFADVLERGGGIAAYRRRIFPLIIAYKVAGRTPSVLKSFFQRLKG